MSVFWKHLFLLQYVFYFPHISHIWILWPPLKDFLPNQLNIDIDQFQPYFGGGSVQKVQRCLAFQISFDTSTIQLSISPPWHWELFCFELCKFTFKLMKTVLFWTILWLWCSASSILIMCAMCFSSAVCSAFGERAGQGFRAGWRYVSVTLHGGGQWGHKIGEEYPRNILEVIFSTRGISRAQEYPRSNILKLAKDKISHQYFLRRPIRWGWGWDYLTQIKKVVHVKSL